jgi:hypothetical protein
MTQQKILEKTKLSFNFWYSCFIPCNKILQIFKFVDVETSSGVTCFPWFIFFLCRRRFHVIKSYRNITNI